MDSADLREGKSKEVAVTLMYNPGGLKRKGCPPQPQSQDPQKPKLTTKLAYHHNPNIKK